MPDVYIVRCADGSLYTGLARTNLEGRVWEHNAGVDPKAYTFERRPVVLVYNEEFDRFDDAIQRERQIKGWSRRKKIALIEGRHDDLPELSLRGETTD
jgi:putative endonuclease